MKERSPVALLLALLFSIASVTFGAVSANGDEAGPLRLGLHGSTLGLGANAEFDLSESFSVRAMFSQLGLDYEETESGNEYTGDLDLQSIGLLADWRPLPGGLRVTGGVFLNNNEVGASARTASAGDRLDIGGTDYSNASIDMLLDFEPIAPYFGVGWSSGYGRPGLGFAVDAGLLYQQAPRVSGSGTAGDCSFRVSDGGTATVTGTCADPDDLMTDLEMEHSDLADELEDFTWYPVLSLGISYRF